jgi:hypothetical protein
MTKVHFPLSNLSRWLSKRPRPRPMASCVGQGERTAEEIIAACRRIAEQPLDDGAVRGVVANYWIDSGTHNYEKTWRPRLELIVQVIEEGEVRLPRALAEVLRRVEAKRNEDLRPGDYVAFNQKVRVPHIGGGYLHRGAIVRTVTELCSPKTQSVLEMGSGWGEHLCNLWLSGGPSHARYYACELAEHGRKCALVLAALDAAFQLDAPCFNYVAPQFGFLPEGQKELVVYSVHSVEQVKELAPDLIYKLCDTADVVKGAHVEPIGWQLIPQAEWNEFTANHQRRCQEKLYNENLWPLLKQAEAEGRIVIDQAVPNFFGLEYNPASLITWHKR